MTAPFSHSINAEIYNWGPALFDAVRQAVLEQATSHIRRELHEHNKSVLLAKIDEVLGEAIPPTAPLNANAVWQAIWPRIVYAGTRASKATAEITSMRELVPWFRHLRNFDPDKYTFDDLEWAQWRAMDAGKRPEPEVYFVRTTPEVWKLLTKDRQAFPNLRFSSWDKKVAKYIAVSNLLWPDLVRPGMNSLHRFTGGITFTPTHKTGIEWVMERQELAKVQQRFESSLGQLTALHTMMDMGLKTIKPDRVMTRLFSDLGWLVTLPCGTPAREFEKAYLRKAVVEEMTVRADVLAKALVDNGVLASYGLDVGQSHRLLDIWFVKYGQEPEPDFGITRNLSAEQPISGVLAAIKSRVTGSSKNIITAQDAAKLWPWPEEFKPVRKRVNTTRSNCGNASSGGYSALVPSSRKVSTEEKRVLAGNEVLAFFQTYRPVLDRNALLPLRNEIEGRVLQGDRIAEAFISVMSAHGLDTESLQAAIAARSGGD